jgi:hypothetical protein
MLVCTLPRKTVEGSDRAGGSGKSRVRLPAGLEHVVVAGWDLVEAVDLDQVHQLGRLGRVMGGQQSGADRLERAFVHGPLLVGDHGRRKGFGPREDLQVRRGPGVELLKVIPRRPVGDGQVRVAFDYFVDGVVDGVGHLGRAEPAVPHVLGLLALQVQPGVVAAGLRQGELRALHVAQRRRLAVPPDENKRLNLPRPGDRTDDRLKTRVLVLGPGELVAEQHAELQLAGVELSGDVQPVGLHDDLAVEAGLRPHQGLERLAGERQ